MRRACLLALAFTVSAAAADWDAVKAQPNLEKRSELALVVADESLAEAKNAWRQADAKTFTAKLERVREAVDLSLESLQKTGKPPHKLLHWYKNAELKTRELSRRLESFAAEVSLEDRPAVQKVNDRVQAVHEELLLGVLSRKK